MESRRAGVPGSPRHYRTLRKYSPADPLPADSSIPRSPDHASPQSLDLALQKTDLGGHPSGKGSHYHGAL